MTNIATDGIDLAKKLFQVKQSQLQHDTGSI